MEARQEAKELAASETAKIGQEPKAVAKQASRSCVKMNEGAAAQSPTPGIDGSRLVAVARPLHEDRDQTV